MRRVEVELPSAVGVHENTLEPPHPVQMPLMVRSWVVMVPVAVRLASVKSPEKRAEPCKEKVREGVEEPTETLLENRRFHILVEVPIS